MWTCVAYMGKQEIRPHILMGRELSLLIVLKHCANLGVGVRMIAYLSGS